MRVTRFSFNADPDPERYAIFPAAFGVTGQAFMGRQVVIEELALDHIDNYPEEVKKFVFKNLRTVIAAPIMDLCLPYGLPIGVLAFDSSLTISDLNITEGEIRGIAQGCADSIAIILFSSPEKSL